MATRITYRTICSLESETAPVRTHRTEIVAANVLQAVRRTLVTARKEFPGVRPRSYVVVLEEISRGTVPGKRRGAA